MHMLAICVFRLTEDHEVDSTRERIPEPVRLAGKTFTIKTNTKHVPDGTGTSYELALARTEAHWAAHSVFHPGLHPKALSSERSPVVASGRYWTGGTSISSAGYSSALPEHVPSGY